MIEEHKQARSNKAQIRFHEFKTTYQKNSKVIYAFCEGKDDLSFYKGAIENVLTENWTVHIWEVGGVYNVIGLHKKLDWRKYNSAQVVFFIDRDLTEFTNEKLPNKKNIYITNNYSIENDIVNWNTCERTLTEVLGLSDLSSEEKDALKELFEEEFLNFSDQMVPIMAWIIKWRRCGHRSCLNAILMQDLFKIKQGKLESIAHPKRFQDTTAYIHKQCNLTIDKDYELRAGIAEFRTEDRHKKFIRGKYLLWFLVEFCLSIHRDCLQMSIIKSISTPKPKNVANFSHSSAMFLISPRCKAPQSLKKFLKNTVTLFIEKK